MIFSNIYNHEMHHLLLSRHAQSHETQSYLHSMKFNRNIYLRKFTNYSHPKQLQSLFLLIEIQSDLHPMKFSHILIPWISVTSVSLEPISYINLMKCTNYSYAVTVLIQSNSITSSLHGIQSHLNPMKFTQIYIPWNSVIAFDEILWPRIRIRLQMTW